MTGAPGSAIHSLPIGRSESSMRGAATGETNAPPKQKPRKTETEAGKTGDTLTQSTKGAER